MKTIILKSILAMLLLTFSIISCDRDTDTPALIVVEPAIFEYAEGGATLRTASNPFANASTKKIFGNNADTNVIVVNLTSLSVGTYTIGTGNIFKYTRPAQTSVWTAISGTITILENDGSKISGSFDLTAGDSNLGINSVSGSFKRVVVNP